MSLFKYDELFLMSLSLIIVAQCDSRSERWRGTDKRLPLCAKFLLAVCERRADTSPNPAQFRKNPDYDSVTIT